jgi:cytidine deaminase
MEEIVFNQLSKKSQQLIKEAKSALQYAYNPYSNFAVGAALTTETGKLFTGTNVENASHGASICAERVALTNAYSAGHRDIQKLAIIGYGNQEESDRITPPCGICRQVYFEAVQSNNKDITVILPSYDNSTVIITSIKELLPLGFILKEE